MKFRLIIVRLICQSSALARSIETVSKCQVDSTPNFFVQYALHSRFKVCHALLLCAFVDSYFRLNIFQQKMSRLLTSQKEDMKFMQIKLGILCSIVSLFRKSLVLVSNLNPSSSRDSLTSQVPQLYCTVLPKQRLGTLTIP